MKFNILLVIMLFFAYSTSAQISFDYHQNQVLLDLKGLSQSEIDDLLQEFEAQELWVSPLTQTRCWYFSAFPGVHEIEIDGETIYLYNIIDASELIKSRTSGGTEGVSVSINPLPQYHIAGLGLTTGFFDPTFFIEGGANEVVLSILDSGITEQVDDSEGYPYDPDVINNTNYVLGSPEYDANSHGTHVAGIANFIGKGSEPSSSTIKMDVRKILNHDNVGDLGAYILSIEEAIVQGAQVLNLSLCFPEVEGNHFVTILIKLLEEFNLLGVVAAGNDALDLSDSGLLASPFGKNIFPAALQSPNLITVASVTDKSSRLSPFSNYGIYNVDVAVQGEMVAGYNIDSEFIGMSGTSQATAIVSGIAANLGTHQSTFDGAAIKCAIVNGVDATEGLIGKIVSEGVVNAQTALAILFDQQDCPDDGSDEKIQPPKAEGKVFPNPFNSDLNMQLEKGVNQISIVDMFGKEVYSTAIKVSNGGMLFHTDQAQAFPSGVYMLTVENETLGTSQTTKLVKN